MTDPIGMHDTPPLGAKAKVRAGVSRRALLAGLCGGLALVAQPISGLKIFTQGKWILKAEDIDAA